MRQYTVRRTTLHYSRLVYLTDVPDGKSAESEPACLFACGTMLIITTMMMGTALQMPSMESKALVGWVQGRKMKPRLRA